MQYESVRYLWKLVIPGIQKKITTMFIMKFVKVQYS